ncbi:hypothetical protein LIER_26517 [Lithospermum erythrorhizon]|uniref:Reverse transcriptase n=1 Tax=Lithospermum erythrorhizon TaxID=34254 RepID=A0AAV3RCV7_LITER
MGKIRNVRVALIEWRKTHNLNLRVQIENIQARIKVAHESDEFDREVVLNLEKELDVAWGDEERKGGGEDEMVLLNQAGKEVLIKAMTFAIPNYVMNCFLLPHSIIANLNNVMAKFFWATSDKEREIYWKS